MQISKTYYPLGGTEYLQARATINKTPCVNSSMQPRFGQIPSIKTAMIANRSSTYEGEKRLPCTPIAASGKNTWSPYSRLAEDGVKMMTSSHDFMNSTTYPSVSKTTPSI